MKKAHSTDNQNQKSVWLWKLKSIFEKAVLLDGIYSDLCPSRFVTDDERQVTLKRAADAKRLISETVKEALAIEADNKAFGITRLVEEPDELTAETLLLLTAGRLDPRGAGMVRRVSDVVGLVAARDPALALFVRSLFRADSSIHKHFVLGCGAVLDDRSVLLRESSFNTVMGLSSDATEYECTHESRTGRR
jgi:hypothetical protein